MATTEAGGIVPQELRDVIAAAQAKFWRSTNPKVLAREAECADAILAEIAAAGYEIQPVARMNRLRWTARVACSVVRAEPGEDFSDVFADLMTCVDDMLQPGDLDRGEGRE
jgi:hypothetical protein